MLNSEKIARQSTSTHQNAGGSSFFRKKGEESFFGEKIHPAFFEAVIQPKLTISDPGDALEKEADAVAEQVIREPGLATIPFPLKEEEKSQGSEENNVQAKPEIDVTGAVQCKEEKVYAKFHTPTVSAESRDSNEMRKASPELSQNIYRFAESYKAVAAMEDTGSIGDDFAEFGEDLSSSKGQGAPMPETTKQFMESRFNADFSDIRVHTGSQSEDLNDSIDAQAFTHGTDIYFNAGKYNTGTSDGQYLLAHELTHTIQQDEVNQQEFSQPAHEESETSTLENVSDGQNILSEANHGAVEETQPDENTGALARDAVMGSDVGPGSTTAGLLPTETQSPEQDDASAIKTPGKNIPARETPSPGSFAINKEEEILAEELVSEEENAINPQSDDLEITTSMDVPEGSAAGMGSSATGTGPEATFSDSSEVPGLNRWKINVSADTSAIPTPALGDSADSATELRQHASSITARRQAVRPNLVEQATTHIPDSPDIPDVPQPDENPVLAEANRQLQPYSDRSFPQQQLPELIVSPRNTLPHLGDRPTLASPPATGSPTPPISVSDIPAAGVPVHSREQHQIEEVRARAGEEVEEGQVTAEANHITIESAPVAPQPALPTPIRANIADVLVRVLANPRHEAEGIMNKIRREMYPRQILEDPGVYPEIGNEYLPQFTEVLTAGLRLIAAEAGIAETELNRVITERQQVLETARQDTEQALEITHQEETDRLQAQGQEDRNAIAGAREAVDLHTERQLEAASGETDPEVIRSGRDRFIQHVNSHVGRQRVAYDQAKTRRERQIDQAEAAYVQAYRTAVQRDEQSLRTPAADIAESQIQIQSALIRNWGNTQERNLHREVVAFKTQVTEWTNSYKEDIGRIGDQEIRRIQDWAIEQLHEHTSWWQALMQRIRNWAFRAREESARWEEVRAGESRDALVGDMAFLRQFRERAGENVDLTSETALQGLTEEQSAIVNAYYGSGAEGRDPVAALAAGLRVRIEQQQREQVVNRIKSALDEKPPADWEKLDRIGQAQNSGFSADHIRAELRQAMFGGITGLGTDEDRIFRALAGLTHEQSLAVQKVYRHEHGSLLETDLNDELGGAEQTRANALLQGDQSLADVATLHEAMHGGYTGIGTDESVIMRTLRGKSEEERQRIFTLYQQQYGVDLQADLNDELGGFELEQGTALMQGDVSRADAAALENAMQGGLISWGTDEEAIQAVYADVRQDVETEAAEANPPRNNTWVEAEIARRNQGVEASYNMQYGNNWQPGDESALRQAYASELSGPELDLTNALADADLIRADAARVAIEAQGVFTTSDEVVNGVLRNQYDRALREIRRDEWPDMERNLQRRAEAEGWDRYRYREEERIMERQLERSAQERSRGYMSQLEERYDSSYNTWGNNSLRNVIENNVSGEDQQMARQLMRQGGHLTPAQEIHYATEGIGTGEEDIRRALAGRSPEEIQQIRVEWGRLHPGENMDERIMSELSGRDQFDTHMLLQGEPRDAREEMSQVRERFNYELENTSGFLSGEQQGIMEARMRRLETQYDILNDANASVDERRRAIELFQYRSGNVQHAVDAFREQSDAVTDSVTTVVSMTAAIAAAVAITLLTAGTAAPAVIAALAALGGSLTATASQIIARRLMQGEAYGWEDMAVDLGVGAVDAIVSVATAGVGGRLIEFAREGSLLFRLANSPQLSRRIMAHVIAEGAEGFISSVPSALAGNILNDQNWEHGNPLANIALGAAIETGIGTVVSGGLGGITNIRSADPNIRTHAITEIPGSGPRADVDINVRSPETHIPPTGIPGVGTLTDLPGTEHGLRSIGEEIDNALPPRVVEADHQLRSALPADLQNRVPINMDPGLTGNTVRVHYDLDANGMVRNIHMRVGPGATAADIALHAQTFRSLEQYSGLSGRLYQLIDRMQFWMGRYGEPPIGSRAFEARLEIDKLPRIIEQRANLLTSGNVDTETQDAIRRDIDNLYDQLAAHRRTLGQIEVEPSRGFVAAQGADIPTSTVAPTTYEAIIVPAPLRNTASYLPFVMQRMRQLDIQPALFQRILDNIPKERSTLFNFMSVMNSLLKTQTDRHQWAPENLNRLLESLGSGNIRHAELVQTLVTTLSRQTTDDMGAVKANRILSILGLHEIDEIISGHSFRSMLEQENPANDFFNALHNVADRIDEPSPRIRDLINRAGMLVEGGATEPDLFRLSAILDEMGEGHHSFDAVENAITRRNEITRELQNVGVNVENALFGGLNLGVDVHGRRSFAGSAGFVTKNGTLSGSLIAQEMRREVRVDAIVGAILGPHSIWNQTSEAQWINFQRLLNLTDIPPGIRGNILGYLWERVNRQRLIGEGMIFRKRPFTQPIEAGHFLEQIEVDIEGHPVSARPDVVIVRGIEVINGVRTIRLGIEEYKAGNAVLEESQEALRDAISGKTPRRLTYHLPQSMLDPPGTKVDIVAEFEEIRGIRP